MKKLLSLLFFKFRLALLAGIGRFIILPIFKALFRRMARQADTVRRAQTEAEPAFAPAYARSGTSGSAPRDPITLDGEWRRINDRRQNW